MKATRNGAERRKTELLERVEGLEIWEEEGGGIHYGEAVMSRSPVQGSPGGEQPRNG